MKVIGIIILIILGLIASTKRFVNLNVILDGLLIYTVYIFMAILIYNMSKLLIWNNDEAYIIIFVIWITL